jgi:predicted RNase H-like HicB family nuclease
VAGSRRPKMQARKTVKKQKVENRTFTVLIEQDEDGYYVATVPALRSCYTKAKTLEGLYPRIREVVALCLEEEEPVPMKFVGVQQLQFSS